MKIQTGGFTRSVQDEILQHLNDDDANTQENLACLLKTGSTGDTLMNFIINLFVRYCFKLKETFMFYYNLDENGNRIDSSSNKVDDNSSEISYSYSKFNLREYLISRLTLGVDPTNPNIIVDIAFSLEEARSITNIILNPRPEGSKQPRNERVLTNYLTTNFKDNDRIHCVLGGINRLNDEPQHALIILQDPDLSEEFITELRQLYNLPHTYTLTEFKRFFKEKLRLDDPPYYIFRLVTKLTGLKNCYKGIYQKNYGRETFVRGSANLETPSISDIPECFKSMKTNGETQYKDISNYYSLENTFHGEIFNHYGRKYVGGVSGTYFYLHFLIFKIFRSIYTRNFETYAKSICVAVLDYVPIWHSLEEILLAVSIEIEQNIINGGEYDFPWI